MQVQRALVAEALTASPLPQQRCCKQRAAVGASRRRRCGSVWRNVECWWAGCTVLLLLVLSLLAAAAAAAAAAFCVLRSNIFERSMLQSELIQVTSYTRTGCTTVLYS